MAGLASTKSDPCKRILDAAERVFATVGFDGASLRHIVREAKVNLPTVYYHFGSKKGLFLAVFDRRFNPIRDEHLRSLRQLEREANGQPLSVEAIMTTLVTPALSLMTGLTTKRLAIMRLMGRIITDPNPEMQALFRNHYNEAHDKFLELLQRSCPELPLLDITWRFQLAIGAMAFTLCNPQRIPMAENDGRSFPDFPAMCAQMVGFFAPGFRAPAASLAAVPAQKICRHAIEQRPQSDRVSPRWHDLPPKHN